MFLDNVKIRSDRFPDTGVYPFNLDVLHKTPQIVLDKSVTFFIGENGSGKSTLLRAICRKAGVHIWEDTSRLTLDNNPYADCLSDYLELGLPQGGVKGSFFDSRTFQDFTRFLDEWAAASPDILKYFGGDSLTNRSHGQSLMKYFESRYKVRGLYFMDEPETALSPKSQLMLLKLLSQASSSDHNQFIIVSHSPILLACPGASIYTFDTAPVSPIGYYDTQYYRIYRDFLNNPESFLAADNNID
ncbi:MULTISPECIES: AAA family ATPase [Dehalococcoides]|jgi:predicted ATPase|uniref:AAA famiily ATPase n=2 Tax=Dehalococcoides mccartyi TaxID=61435 RepID=A0A142VB26_9CHLR|nr:MULTISPECIES: AAA family ATPase [Dehalococcoides]AGG06777.1 putative ATPase [Dehalococcoides mccartyi DCMB5]AII61275.1 ATPase AAA [Dehalococcoides mccartyi CG5]AMU86972.1 AAA famiily ATPase [Dehalococcoides mccartyi]AOV99759.1 ABC transporter, ATP-binding protein [Dehalococcoides mccartyi]AQX74989.1 AAA family ATPase [Dehalococcoides mccartyi]